MTSFLPRSSLIVLALTLSLVSPVWAGFEVIKPHSAESAEEEALSIEVDVREDVLKKTVPDRNYGTQKRETTLEELNQEISALRHPERPPSPTYQHSFIGVEWMSNRIRPHYIHVSSLLKKVGGQYVAKIEAPYEAQKFQQKDSLLALSIGHKWHDYTFQLEYQLPCQSLYQGTLLYIDLLDDSENVSMAVRSEISMQSVVLSARYDMRLAHLFTPYVQAGVGVTSFWGNVHVQETPGGFSKTPFDTYRPNFLLGMGLQWAPFEHTTLDLSYRCFHVLTGGFRFMPQSENLNAFDVQFRHLESRGLHLGVHYVF